MLKSITLRLSNVANFFRQVWLWLGLLLHFKKVNLIYFEAVQQELINGIPAFLCWDAKFYYKVTVNNINVTVNKSPILMSEQYDGKFLLTAYGMFSKVSKEINLNVKSYDLVKQIMEVKPKYTQRKTDFFLEIEGMLKQIPIQKIETKKTSIKISKSKFQKLSLKSMEIINPNFVESLKVNSTFNNYQQEFINEQIKNNGK